MIRILHKNEVEEIIHLKLECPSSLGDIAGVEFLGRHDKFQLLYHQ